jgi:hypothetical protein
MSEKSCNDMTTLADIELDKIDNPKEKEILKLLKEKEKCLYGNILTHIAA